MVSVNQESMKLVRRMLANSERMGVQVHRLPNGTTVVDTGLAAPGGWQAARAVVEISLGGLASVNYEVFRLKNLELPLIRVFTDFPMIACLSCQISGWALKEMKSDSGIVPLVSGPIRAIVRNDMFSEPFDYEDRWHETVAVLQDDRIPDVALTGYLAAEAGVDPENLYVLVAPTGSLVGFINVIARTLETSIWRLHTQGLDVSGITSAWGSAPLPPPTLDEFSAMVRVNTFTYYGGSAGYMLRENDEKISAVLDQLTLSPRTTSQYGIPFGQLLREAGGDIFNMREFCHSVARINLFNTESGRYYQYGEIDEDMLWNCLQE